MPVTVPISVLRSYVLGYEAQGILSKDNKEESVVRELTSIANNHLITSRGCTEVSVSLMSASVVDTAYPSEMQGYEGYARVDYKFIGFVNPEDGLLSVEQTQNFAELVVEVSAANFTHDLRNMTLNPKLWGLDLKEF